jgi:hypothetical protein
MEQIYFSEVNRNTIFKLRKITFFMHCHGIHTSLRYLSIQFLYKSYELMDRHKQLTNMEPQKRQ